MNSKKLNILHVINSLEIGGAETFLLRLIKAQIKTGHNVSLLIISPSSNDPLFEVEWVKVLRDKIHTKWNENTTFSPIGDRINGLTYRVFKKKSYDSYLRNQKRKYYQNIFTKNQIEIVNSHLLGSDFFVLNELKECVDFPFVVTSQGCYNDYKNIDNINRLIPEINGMTYVASKNLNIFNEANEKLTSNKKLVYNGMPLPDKSSFKKRSTFGINDGDFVFGQLTRSILTKGLEVSIKAILKMVKDNGVTDVKLVIVGPENDYYNELKDKYADHSCIIFPGVSISPTDFVGMFDVGLLPSYFPSESCPSTIVEYLSCGKPVISTGVGEIKSMIDFEGRKAGLIIDDKDEDGIPDYSAFSNAAFELYSNKEKYLLYKEVTLKAYSKFSINLIEKEYYEIYKAAIDFAINK